jgi:phosphatidate cytidylyltransferase
MLKYRLLFGTIMMVGFTGLLLLDGYLDGSLTDAMAGTGILSVQGSILAAIIMLLVIPAQFEISNLAKKTGAVIFKPITIIFSVLFAGAWYFRQFHPHPLQFHLYYMLSVSAFAVLAVFLYQGRLFGTKGTIVNCSASLFSIFYLGFLSSFVLGIRVEFGLWPMLMAIIVVKSSDIGAYTIGRLFGKHKFAPVISPGKSWEGIAGAAGFAIIVAMLFAHFAEIMTWPQAILFGAAFAYLGQLGDLAESMLKRDAAEKDSSESVPGFGGVLDIIDSPLVTAPLAYAFLKVIELIG